jgi:hypothetical protein
MIDPFLRARLDSEVYASYGDASHTNAGVFKDVEVLATVPAHINDFAIVDPPNEVKYGYYEVLLKQNKREAEKWDQVLAQASIYVFDPQPALDRMQDHWLYQWVKLRYGQIVSEWWLMDKLATDVCRLVPQVWLHAVDLMDGVALKAVGNVGRATNSMNNLIDGCSGSFVNVRRVMLEGQHVFRHVLDHRPRITSFDEPTDELSFKAPVQDVIVSIAPPVVFDEGHCRDLDILEGGRLQQRRRLERGLGSTGLPAHVPGRIELASSKKLFALQVADVAAGRARDIYAAKGALTLTEYFADVVVNGRRLSAIPNRGHLTRARY